MPYRLATAWAACIAQEARSAREGGTATRVAAKRCSIAVDCAMGRHNLASGTHLIRTLKVDAAFHRHLALVFALKQASGVVPAASVGFENHVTRLARPGDSH
jgi:hypothetical protein